MPDELLKHIHTRVTDEGLIIEVFDDEGSPLFASGSSKPMPLLIDLLDLIGSVVGFVSNDIAISGHTSAVPFSGGGYSNWELSSDRALVARRILSSVGVAEERFRRVTGKAAREPVTDDPNDVRNRRIAITVLRNS